MSIVFESANSLRGDLEPLVTWNLSLNHLTPRDRVLLARCRGECDHLQSVNRFNFEGYGFLIRDYQPLQLGHPDRAPSYSSLQDEGFSGALRELIAEAVKQGVYFLHLSYRGQRVSTFPLHPHPEVIDFRSRHGDCRFHMDEWDVRHDEWIADVIWATHKQKEYEETGAVGNLLERAAVRQLLDVGINVAPEPGSPFEFSPRWASLLSAAERAALLEGWGGDSA
ncbi:hypothetical protein [Alienimonas sp. DA493]|uniref:DUF5983 family protein n=1 Tax=Alienimonas sp. DA493 TaxID=3373605 RepID=UPI003754BB60